MGFHAGPKERGSFSTFFRNFVACVCALGFGLLGVTRGGRKRKKEMGEWPPPPPLVRTLERRRRRRRRRWNGEQFPANGEAAKKDSFSRRREEGSWRVTLPHSTSFYSAAGASTPMGELN